LRPIRFDEVIARQHAQPPVELARPLHDSLDMRAHDLGHAQRFVCTGAQHREQRSHHQRHKHQERHDRRRHRSAVKDAREPPIHRIAQAGKDRREQNCEEERADHRDERGRDRGNEQKQERLTEAGVSHGRRDMTSGRASMSVLRG
jgi:hypothetical protein